MGLVSFLKGLPIDLGQGNRRFDTKGKTIAKELVPAGGMGKRLLDVGCREGAQSRAFEALGYRVASIDVDARYEKCVVCDANDALPFRDGTFDVVWSSEVIEHLKDPAAAIREMHRVVRPGGVIVMTTPNSYALYFRLLALVGLTPRKIQRRDHLHFFDRGDIDRLCPHATVFGFLPFTLVRPRIRRMVGVLSPTFVILDRVGEGASAA